MALSLSGRGGRGPPHWAYCLESKGGSWEVEGCRRRR